MIDIHTNTTAVILLSDNSSAQETITEKLSDFFEVTIKQTEQEALKHLLQTSVKTNLVILDLIHSKERGFAFLEMRKESPPARNIPVLSMTLSDDLHSVIKTFELGSSDYFSYPIASDKLIASIFELLQNHQKPKTKNPLQEKLDFQDSENGVGFFSYTPHCLTPMYVNSKILTKNHFPSFEKFCSKIPNALNLLDSDMRMTMEQKIEKAIETKGSFTFSLQSLSASFQISWIPYPSSEKPVLLLVAINSCEQDTKQKELILKLELDTLTGLYNREAFYGKAKNLIKEHPETTYLYIRWNVIRFKMINDMYGNTKGNEVLRYLAIGFLKWVNHRGICGRFYSDQFAICMPKKEFNPEQFAMYSLKLLHETCLNMNLQMTFGMFEITDPSLPVERMNDRAKLAMRNLKGNETEAYCFYNEAMRNKVLSAQKVMDSFENALKTKQFVIYLQPIHNVTYNTFTSAEALVRWVTPEHGIVSPLEFIPLFEENGFIEKLDLYVLEQVCILQRSLLDEGKNPLPISSNLSRVDFFNPELCLEIIAIVDQYTLPHSLIKLEITETAYMDNPKQLLQTISVLQKQGFEILMDDFGSGYSSLNILQEVPIDILKLDQLFTSEIGTSNKAETIIQNIVNMALGINLRVIAEGVETKEQVNFLKSIGCDTLQGYFFSKPIPENDYRLLIGSNEKNHSMFKQVKNLTLPPNNLLFSRYGKLLKTVFLTISELNFSQDTFKTVYADNSFTSLPYGTAGTLLEMESKLNGNLIHPDDRTHYIEEINLRASGHTGKMGSYYISEFRILDRNESYIPVIRILIKTETFNGDNLYLSFLARKEDRKLASAMMESIKELETKRKTELHHRIIHQEKNFIAFEWDLKDGKYFKSPGFTEFEISKVNLTDLLENRGTPFAITTAEEEKKLFGFLRKATNKPGNLTSEIFHLKRTNGLFTPVLLRLYCSADKLVLQKKIIGTISILEDKPLGWSRVKKAMQRITT
jgi:diguanylate cyclase (GGDEF)-like protein